MTGGGDCWRHIGGVWRSSGIWRWRSAFAGGESEPPSRRSGEKEVLRLLDWKEEEGGPIFDPWLEASLGIRKGLGGAVLRSGRRASAAGHLKGRRGAVTAAVVEAGVEKKDCWFVCCCCLPSISGGLCCGQIL